MLNLAKSPNPLSSLISTKFATIIFSRAIRSIFRHRSSVIFHKRSFHTSLKAMVAQKIDGTAIAKYVPSLAFSVPRIDLFRLLREDVKNEIIEIQKRNPRFKPGLAIIQVGDRPDSTTY